MGEHFDAGLRALELELDEGLPYLKTGALLGRARRELLGEELLIMIFFVPAIYFYYLLCLICKVSKNR